ncbi:hypothetical protein NB311A_16394 [Nitrobacter sp. Nb-311A]|nr:hypothetical protein NB311A_16394 [Nitrobacter sp. Nb-311A]
MSAFLRLRHEGINQKIVTRRKAFESLCSLTVMLSAAYDFVLS